jgi:exonuclease III
MQIVAWNMAHRVSSWEALAALEYDAALLSEARVPSTYRGCAQGGGDTKGADAFPRPWATAIVSPHRLTRIEDARAKRYGRPLTVPFRNSRPGSWEAAVALMPSGEDVTLVSLYGLMDERSDASVHRSLSELSGLLEDERYNKRLVLGGDLNIWTGWAAGSAHLARDRNVLDRIEAHGLFDALAGLRDGPPQGCVCSLADACRHTRTRLDKKRPDVPYQMDYVFVSKAMKDRLTSCIAKTHEEWPSPSDHFPILANFDDA